MKKYAIIVAGGKGLRMGSELPKQFLLLRGKPLLMHTLAAFKQADADTALLLVLPSSHRTYWQSLCETYEFDLPIQLIDGGETRFHSVKNGLEAVPEGALVAIHDGVRPLVSTALIDRAFAQAAEQGGVIPTIALVDSIRCITAEGGSKAVDRSAYLAVQTPQCFQSTLLKGCYNQPYQDTFTDDASVYEAAGHTICCVAGERENIKITTPMDLKIAETVFEG